MTRDEIQYIFDEIKKVEKALGGLPYRDAIPALNAMDEIRDVVGEGLLGGYYGICIGCEEIKGQDEMVDCGDENLCRSCANDIAGDTTKL